MSYRTPVNTSNKKKINPKGKRCSACKKFKKWDQFWKNKTARDGYNNQCGKCMYQYIQKNRSIGFKEYVPQKGPFFRHQKLVTI